MENQEQPKFSTEQLTEMLHQVSAQNQQLQQQVINLNMTNVFKRLDYLFEVVKVSESFPVSFVDKCVSEIEELLTYTEEDTTSETTE